KDAPTIFGHLDVIELRPAIGFDTGSGAKIDLEVVAFVGAHVVQPTEVGRLPMFEGALQDAVAAEVDIVRYFFGVINHFQLLRIGPRFFSNSFPIKFYGRAGSVDFERAVGADGVGANENPVLPSGEAAEDAGFEGFLPAETEIGLEAGEGVG